MFEITQQARTELHTMLGDVLSERTHDERDGIGFRLVVAADGGGGLGLTLDAVRDGDEVFDHDGTHILLIDAFAMDLVDDLVLDIVDTEAGKRLHLRHVERSGGL